MVWEFDWSDVPGATQYHLYVIGPTANGTGHQQPDAHLVVLPVRNQRVFRRSEPAGPALESAGPGQRHLDRLE